MPTACTGPRYLASCIGIPRITAIELGVAGGRGLLALEAACAEIGTFLGVKIDVVGFDGGEGLPPPVDYRDLPHVWDAGYYKMDQAALRAKLQSAKLVIGDVAVTVKHWLRDSLESPLGFIAFDLDYYSSTKAALALLDGPESTHLPRVHCYFDDLAAGDQSCMNRYVGEYLAIDEFNAAHQDRKICLIEQLRINRPSYEQWQERMYVFPQLFAREVHTGGSTRRTSYRTAAVDSLASLWRRGSQSLRRRRDSYQQHQPLGAGVGDAVGDAGRRPYHHALPRASESRRRRRTHRRLRRRNRTCPDRRACERAATAPARGSSARASGARSETASP